MSLPQHRNLPTEERHGPTNKRYADAAAREAATGFVADDVGEIYALQEDDFTKWLLIDHSPVTWQADGSVSQTDIDDAVAVEVLRATTEETNLANAINALAEGRSFKDAVRAATTANITLSGAQTIDGVSIIAGDRVLVKNQTTGSQNGIYLCAAGAWTRTVDLDAAAEFPSASVAVQEGSSQADTTWTCTNDAPVTVGTTAIVFIQTGTGTTPTTTTEGALINGATGKSTPVDADMIGLMDSAASNVLKKLSWANVKATLKTYFDTLYLAVGAITTSGLTQATGKILGRTTASTGAIEELSPKAVHDLITIHGSDVASAGTTDLDAATGDLVDVTGTTTITAITLAEGRVRTVRFTGALILTHGSSLALPNAAANITTAAGDVAIFRGYAAGVVRCVGYTRASGAALAGSSLPSQTGNGGKYLKTDGSSPSWEEISGVLAADAANLTLAVPATLPPSGYAQIYANYALTNKIPTMSSATAPSGTASDSEHFSGCDAWKAMSDGTPNGWLTNGTALPQWIKYQFTSARTITRYEITPWSVDNYPARTPKTWILQGSNDGSTWTDLDSRTNYTTWTISASVRFLVASPGSYSYYRLYITANVGANAYTGIKAFALLNTETGSALKLIIRDSAGVLSELNGTLVPEI